MNAKWIIAALVIVWCGCGGPGNEDEGKSVFRFNEASGISSLDPAFARDQANIWGVNQLFNGLVQLNDQLEVEPCIAYRWAISEDGTEYTFHLRDDVFFHPAAEFAGGKGRRVTAADFVFSFNRIIDPAIASPGAWVFNGVAKDPFQALDDSTLVIRLSKSFPPFIGLLAMQYCSVVPTEVVTRWGKDFRIHPVGTGPFVFKEWHQSVQLVLLRNENYFEYDNGERLPFLDAVSISFISDKQSAFLEFIKGNLDFISGIDGSYKDDLLTNTGHLRPKYKGRFVMLSQPYLNTEYIGILMDSTQDIVRNSPLRMKAVRQAINYGFDRQKMITYLRNNIGTPAMAGFIPKGLPGFDDRVVSGYNYDPARARKLLAEAGFEGGMGLPVITLSTTNSYQDISEYIQSQLGDIGVKINLEVNQAGTHREMVAKSKLNLFRGSWIADYPDAENYLALFYSRNFTPAGPNYTRYSNPAYDKLYELALHTVDPQQRIQIYQQMDRMLIDDAPFIVLYYDQVVRLVQNNIEGLGNNALNLVTLKRVRKR